MDKAASKSEHPLKVSWAAAPQAPVSGSSTRNDNDQTSTSSNINARGAANVLEFERRHAIQAYEAEHGKNSAASPSAQAELAEDWARAVNRSMDAIYTEAQKEVSNAENRDDVVSTAVRPQSSQ